MSSVLGMFCGYTTKMLAVPDQEDRPGHAACAPFTRTTSVPTTRDLADTVANGAFIRFGERRHARYQVRISVASIAPVIIVRKKIECSVYLSVSLSCGAVVSPAGRGDDKPFSVITPIMLSILGKSTVL